MKKNEKKKKKNKIKKEKEKGKEKKKEEKKGGRNRKKKKKKREKEKKKKKSLYSAQCIDPCVENKGLAKTLPLLRGGYIGGQGYCAPKYRPHTDTQGRKS